MSQGQQAKPTAVFVDGVAIGSGPRAFILEFVQTLGQERGAGIFVGRFVMTPAAAKEFLAKLGQLVAGHEARFGPIDTDDGPRILTAEAN